MYSGKFYDHFFVHAFLTMEWNLMVRSDKCVNMHVQHIQWRLDCSIFYFVTSKGNQMEDRYNNPWHVYPNPKNPKMCPVLDLSKYFFSHPYILITDSKLFPGNYQYEIFLNIVHIIINDNLEEFQFLGVEKGKIGSKSASKGSITIVASGCTVSPPMYSIF